MGGVFMIDPRDMKPEEAKKLLIKQIEQRRQRQRDYRSRAVSAGRSKVNTYLSIEASQVFEHCKKGMHMAVSDILSEALLCYQACGYEISRSLKKTPVKASDVVASPSVPSPSPPDPDRIDVIPYDRKIVWKRIEELTKQGIGATRIAAGLSAEGYLTVKGNSKWDREVVRRIVNQLGDRQED
jgi:hypothetical protein